MNPLDADHPVSGSRTGSSHAPATLRPRNNRAASSFAVGEPNGQPGSPTTTVFSPFQSPYHSRAASPIPSKHPSRSSSTNPSRRPTADGRGHASASYLNPAPNNDLAAQLSGLWGKSWTSLQGLASNVLGSDGSQELIKDKAPQRIRKSRDSSQASNKWGPNGRDVMQPGGGSREERQALVRAKRREELLSTSTLQVASSHKRRTSDEFESASAPPGEYDDRDTLVYIHHVSARDTLPGISIKYNCQLAIIKKANRLWSNDGISARKTLVIPVDACAIRGRRVSGPGEQPVDLLGDDTADKLSKLLLNGNNNGPTSDPRSNMSKADMSPPSNGISTPASTGGMDNNNNNNWRHDHWTLLENHTQPTEVVRVPRNGMGYFPRPRRKSVTFSDAESPSNSLELARPTIRVSDESIDSRALGHRKRRSSSEHFGKYMIGPGGVGTLRGKGASTPGPSEDNLTKVLGKLNPKTPTRPMSAEGDDYFHDQTQSGMNSLEHLGGQVEAWVRKLAKNAAKVVEPLPSPGGRPQVRTSTRRSTLKKRPSLALPSGTGDLIELDSTFEIGDDEEDEDERTAESSLEDDRGRKRSTGTVTVSGFSKKQSATLTERTSPQTMRKGASNGGGVDVARKKGL